MSRTLSAPIMLNSKNAIDSLIGVPIMARQALEMVTQLHSGSLEIILPDGRLVRIEGKEKGPNAHLNIHNYRFISRALQAGTVGVAESYIEGEWSSKDVTEFLSLFCINYNILLKKVRVNFFKRSFLQLFHWWNTNTKRRSKKNISAHYDLGNDFYSLWLDETMTYSSALFETGKEKLSEAQRKKYLSLAEKTHIETEHHILEIGCGWGGFAEFAAKEIGCRVTGITISPAQYEFAKRRIYEAGLAEKVEIKFADYRDERGLYDRILSIEMFEAVGEKYWPVYFAKLRDRLRSGGVAGLQVITMSDENFAEYKKTPDFIQRYIFPGGMLPSPSALTALSRKSGLREANLHIFGHDYARTLALWRERFWQSWPRLENMGFDKRFKRLWEYYLHYCEAGFRTQTIDVRQIVYARD